MMTVQLLPENHRRKEAIKGKELKLKKMELELQPRKWLLEEEE